VNKPAAAESIADRYLRLGLRLDRHGEGTVGAYFGPPELTEAFGRSR
jgi:hypothetical protein